MTDFVNHVFGSSVHQAVQTSVTESKPLIAFLSNENESSVEFIFRFLYTENGEELNQPVVDLLQNHYVAVKLVEKTTEYEYFSQIFKDLVVPSFYIVHMGKLLGVVTYDTEPEEWKRSLKNFSFAGQQHLLLALQPLLQQLLLQQITPPLSSTPSSDSSAVHSPSPSPIPSLLHRETPPPATIRKLYHRRTHSVIKREQNAERERIRALLESDQRERESHRREIERKKQIEEEAKLSLAQTRSSMQGKCVLSIKLFDGSSLRYEFLDTDTLKDVRRWLDEETEHGIISKEVSTMPAFATPSDPLPTNYVFYTPAIPRITFTEGQETESLKSLKLSPRSALILKPIFELEPSKPRLTASGVIKSVGKKVRVFSGALFSFFDYGIDYIEDGFEDADHDNEREPTLENLLSASSSNKQTAENDTENYFKRLLMPHAATPPLVSIPPQSQLHQRRPAVLRSASCLSLQPGTAASNLTSPKLEGQSGNDPISRSGTPKLSSASSRIRLIGGNGAEDESAEKGHKRHKKDKRDDDLAYNGNSIGLQEHAADDKKYV